MHLGRTTDNKTSARFCLRQEQRQTHVHGPALASLLFSSAGVRRTFRRHGPSPSPISKPHLQARCVRQWARFRRHRAMMCVLSTTGAKVFQHQRSHRSHLRGRKQHAQTNAHARVSRCAKIISARSAGAFIDAGPGASASAKARTRGRGCARGGECRRTSVVLGSNSGSPDRALGGLKNSADVPSLASLDDDAAAVSASIEGSAAASGSSNVMFTGGARSCAWRERARATQNDEHGRAAQKRREWDSESRTQRWRMVTRATAGVGADRTSATVSVASLERGTRFVHERV